MMDYDLDVVARVLREMVPAISGGDAVLAIDGDGAALNVLTAVDGIVGRIRSTAEVEKWDEAILGPKPSAASLEAAIAALALASRLDVARAECARRIFARASAATQSNINLYLGTIAARSESRRTAQQAADLKAIFEGSAWIAEMRARCPEIAAKALDPTDDANWPEMSEAAAALAARF
jgi:hypothetical protein